MPSLHAALNNANVGLFPPLFVGARMSSTVGAILEGGTPPPFIDSNINSAHIALENLLPLDGSRCSSSGSYAESNSDYDNNCRCLPDGQNKMHHHLPGRIMTSLRKREGGNTMMMNFSKMMLRKKT